MDEPTIGVERRAGEVTFRLEFCPLGRQEDLVDQHAGADLGKFGPFLLSLSGCLAYVTPNYELLACVFPASAGYFLPLFGAAVSSFSG